MHKSWRQTLVVACLFVIASLFVADARAQVVINELHYHPADSAVDIGAGEDPEDLQFLELLNTGTGAVDLTDWSFTGLTFVFPATTSLGAGEYLVVARNVPFLVANGPAIPGGVQVFQWTTGNLDNGGERISLVDDVAALVDEVDYLDEAPWTADPDGTGPSLELLHPDFDNAFPSVWRASTGVNGTPGAVNSVFSEKPVVLDESPARLSGLTSLTTVTVTFSEPVENVAAGNLSVDGSSAATLVCATCVAGVGAGPYEFSGFATPLDSPFDIDLDAGSIQDEDSNTFDGDSWIYVPAVVLNEIHYHPADSAVGPTEDPEDLQFLELLNTWSGSLDLSSWSFEGLTLVIPPATTLASGQYLIVAKNAAFLQANGPTIPGGVQVLQWTAGNLSNGGEPVGLLDNFGSLVDRVVYSDDPPWPTSPDGDGPSLELIHPSIDNSLARAWTASAGTNGTPGAQNSEFDDAPIVVSEDPERGTVIAGLTEVSVTFHEPVTGVAAGNLTVNGDAATTLVCPTCVAGVGAGPYEFSGFATPAVGVVDVALGAGAIQDLSANAFQGDAWQYAFSLPAIVINELHYHPADSAAPGENPERLQFLELYNADSVTVDLSGWSVVNGIDHDFPQGIEMLPGEYLLLAEDDAFLSATISLPAVQLYTWDAGNLDNGGERVRLVDATGNPVDDLTYADRGEWPRSPDGDGPSLELISPLLPNEYGAAWRASIGANGTPGAQNSVFEANAAPIIFDVSHDPAIPGALAPVTITAHVLDDGGLPPTVTLFHRQDAGTPVAYTPVTMLDNGTSGDGAAGDGVFGVVLDPGLPEGQRLDFAIQAGDGVGTAVAPQGHDCNLGALCAGQSPSQTYLCKFSDAALPSDYPTYHLITTQVTRTAQDAHNKTEYDATFIRCDAAGLNCEIFYNVIERYRGQSSINEHPHSYRVDFSEGQPLDSEMGFPITRLNLHAQQASRQELGYQMFESIGDPAPSRQFIRLNTNPLSHGGTQEWIYINIERVDDDFFASQDGLVPLRFPDRCSGSGEVCAGTGDCPVGESCVLSGQGNGYRGRHNSASSRLEFVGLDPDSYRVDVNDRNGLQKVSNEDEDIWDDVIQLVDALDCDAGDGGLLCVENTYNGVYPTLLPQYADVDQWARWYAMHMVLNNVEGGIYRDSGDDYFIYFWPTFDHATFLATDMDAIFASNMETIWRTNVQPIQRFLRHEAFTGRFLGALCDQLDTVFSQAEMDARIDALPDEITPQPGQSTGQGNGPIDKAGLKAWVTTRTNYINNQLTRQTTLTGVPASPYTDPDPVISLSGALNQCHAASVVVNGQPANFTIATPNGGPVWSFDFTLVPGANNIVVQTLDYNGVEVDRAQDSVIYTPPGTGGEPAGLRLTLPTRMVSDKTLTMKAEILDALGEIHWQTWADLGTVSARRVSDQSDVPLSITIFESNPNGVGGGTPPADSIRFYNGVGSVSITLDDPGSVAGEDIEVSVSWGGFSATKVVSVLDNQPGLFRTLTGTLTGPDLIWGPGDGVIHLTGNVTVPSGSTLSIAAGTLVMADQGTSGNGVAVFASDGPGGGFAIDAQGSEANPIYFFPTNGAAALVLPQTQQNNPDSWRGFALSGSGTSNFEYVFVAGAGNGPLGAHPRAAIFRMEGSHSVNLFDSVAADCPGKIVFVVGSGTLDIRRNAWSRGGFGGEFLGSNHTLRIEDSWFTRFGYGPESLDLDGDIFHMDNPTSDQYMNRSVLSDCGDDMIDHSGANPVVENSLIWDADDKCVSLSGGGSVTFNNVLVFDMPLGINGAGGIVSNTTFANVNGPINGAPISVDETITWSAGINIGGCDGNINYTLTGNANHIPCGVGNLSTNPLFQDPGNRDYSLQAVSPAATAGPTGGRIGWLGFPDGSVCVVDGDCDDGNQCTTDTCDAGACIFTPIPGCTPCDTDPDCNDSDPCTLDTCVGGICSNVPGNDGASCDDGLNCTSPDQCSGGSCVGPDACPPGQSCDPEGECAAEPIVIAFTDGGTYTGTQDTFLREAAPDTIHGVAIAWEWDAEDPAPSENVGMIRFDDIVGLDAGQIPQGAVINSATLTLYVFDAGGTPPGEIYLSLVDWDETLATWNDVDGVGSAFDPVAHQGSLVATAPAGPINTFQDVDVLSAVQGWVNNPASNFGLIFRSIAVDGVQVYASEYTADPGLRPVLTIEYQPAGCDDDGDCSDGLYCTGVETCVAEICVPGTPVDCDDGVVCTADSCNEGTDSCDHVDTDVLCDDGNVCTDEVCDPLGPGSDPFTGCIYTNNTGPCDDLDACTENDSCVAGVCEPGTALDCDDGIDCTFNDCDPLSGCDNSDDCPVGEVCNHTTEICEVPQGPQAGDLIIAGFMANGVPEWIELFNTTNQTIALDTLEIISRVDSDSPEPPATGPDGIVDDDWVMPDDLTGQTIAPRSFYLIGEPTTTPAADLPTNLDLATGEGGTTERAISLEVLLEGEHMDYVVYGRHDGSTPAGELPPGDLFFDGVSWPRAEVIRTLSGVSFGEGVTQRLSEDDLYAGHDVEGYYTDEASLPDGFPVGVWTSAHATTGGNSPRNSSTPPVDPPFCDDDGDCDDGDPCNGDETCNVPLGECEAGTPAADDTPCPDGDFCNGDETCQGGVCTDGADPSCDDGVACTVDTCNEATDSCDHAPCSMSVGSMGARYLAVTPPSGLASVALSVDAAGLTCLPRYVDAAGRLTDTPFFQSSIDWGTIFVADNEVVPATQYDVQAEVTLGTSIGSGSATTWSWGQTNNADDVNVFDILCVLNGFGGDFSLCTLQGADLMGFVPNAVIDIDDITGVLDAFQSLPYPDATPCAAPAPPQAAGSGPGNASGTGGGLSAPSLRDDRPDTGGTPSPTFIRLVPSRTVYDPGQEVRIDAYLDETVDLRGYQVAIDVTGGRSGWLALEDVEIESERNDYVFAGEDNYPATDLSRRRMASALLQGGISVPTRVYLGTFTLQATENASGVFHVAVRTSETALRDSFGSAIEIEGSEIPINIAPPPAASGQGGGSTTPEFDSELPSGPSAPRAPVTTVPYGSTWKYLDDGSDQGTAWRAIGFTDSGWSSGPAELGYGDGDEATTVGFGPDANNKYITTYFRHTFTVANAASVSSVALGVVRDDGVVVYLNGTEVCRDNISTDPVLYDTLADSPAIGGVDESTPVACPAPDPGLLVTGDNVLAVEIHQQALNSSDISFNLELILDTLEGIPDAPTLISPANGATGVVLSPELRVNVTDPDSDPLDVTFYGRLDGGAPPPENFTLIHVGDMQFYAASNPPIYLSVMNWIRDNQATRNIVFVSSSGDIVNTASNNSEWVAADAGYSILEPSILPDLMDGIPFGMAPGNHDSTPNGNPDGTASYNSWFGIDRFCPGGTCRSYYGGNFDGTDNDNNFALFSAGGMDFIVVHMEYDTSPDPAVLTWADNLLETHSDRRAIITSHYMLEIASWPTQSSWGTQGQLTYNQLLDRPNLFLMLAGHKHGEGRRQEIRTSLGDVWAMVANYQDYSNSGLIRILDFNPATDEIQVSTFSPWLSETACLNNSFPGGGVYTWVPGEGCFKTDTNGEFVFSYDMEGGPPFVNLGTVTDVPSGADAFLTWPGLSPSAEYEWYVDVSDGTTTTTGPTWTFTTECSVDGDCDDGNVCTIDSCNAGTCEYSDNDGASCDDDDLCTTTDECSLGSCSGTAVSCPVDQSCDPDSGLCLADPIFVTFQQDVDAYTGTQDTFFQTASPAVVNGALQTWEWDDDDPNTTGNPNYGLVRFDDIFNGGGVPTGVEIESATLTYVTWEPGVTAEAHEMLVDWDQSDDLTTACGAACDAGVDYAAASVGSAPGPLGTNVVDVTSSVQAWSTDPSSNYGWIFIPPAPGATGGGAQHRSSEYVTVAERPLLTVSYRPCLQNEECDDGNPCTDDTCNAGICDNLPNTDSCDDGDLCTLADECSAGSCGGTPVSCPVGQTCDPGSGICEVIPTEVTFQDGFDGYVGTQDSFLQEAVPGNVNGALDHFEWDDEDPAGSGNANFALLRFDDIIGAGAGQIPLGATIVVATVTYNVYNDGNSGDVHEAILDWDESNASLTSFCGTACEEGVEYAAGVIQTMVANIGTQTVDVSSSIQSWVNNPSANRGWVIVPTPFGTGGNEIRSSEYATAADRPKLTVRYIFAEPCDEHSDCDDSLHCNGVESCDIGGTDLCLPGIPVDCNDSIDCTIDNCNETTDSCDNVASDALCDDADVCTDDLCDPGTGDPVTGCAYSFNNDPCEDGDLCTENDTCSGGACGAGTAVDCDDGIACTFNNCIPASGCDNPDDCDVGEVCNHTTEICEVPQGPQAGDLVIAGIQASGSPEWLELFNTTASSIALDDLQLVVRIDANGDGAATVDWQLPSGLLTGATIQAHSFFLLGEPATSPAADLPTDLNFATGEGGTRAISMELVVGGVHMDYLLYGRDTLEPGATADVPPGDRPFDGVTFPRTEVIRSINPLTSFSEGVTQRVTDDDLYAGYDVEGFYTDEDSLPGTNPNGVWTSAHSTTGGNSPRNSASPPVNPPFCDDNGDCDDGDPCNGDETCNIGTGECEAGSPLADDTPCPDSTVCNGDETCQAGACTAGAPPDCDDGEVCTTDTCDAVTGCDNAVVADDTPCEDTDPCNGDETCQSGVCTDGPDLDCDDLADCTDDSCTTNVGCEYEDLCPTGEVCDVPANECVAVSEWTAYNDLSWYAGQLDTNITTITSPTNTFGLPSSGELVEYATGNGTGVTLTVTGGTHLASIQGAEATIGDAFDIFNGIVSTFGVISYVNDPPDLTLELTGLDPDVTYEVVFHGHRDSYAWDRAALVTISDADDFTNDSSSPGDNPADPEGDLFDGPTDPSTRLPSDNDAGYVARFIDIDPGLDGDLTLTVSADGIGTQGKYASALMLGASFSECVVDVDCDDAEDCTDDFCDPLDPGANAEGCVYTNNNDPCDDLDACTENDTCAGGSCQPGTAVDCGLQYCNPADGTCVECLISAHCLLGEVCNPVTFVCEPGPVAPPLPIVIGDDWRYFKGTEEPTPADLTLWTSIGFDDSTWSEGPTGIGYDYYVETGGTNGNGDYEPFIATELDDMRNCTPIAPPLCNDPGYVSVYMRKAFYVANPANVTSLTFQMYADDGYVAYLNGTEVARIRVTGTPPLYNTTVTGGPSGSPPVEQTIDLTGDIGLLVSGVNVLAVQGHNANLSSRDLLMLPQLESIEEEPCDDNSDCDDADVCNGLETCNLGTGNCEAGTPLNCDDVNACTTDTCDPVSGCDNADVADDTPCADTDPCNGDETCQSGVCTDGPDLDCDDLAACTDDSCATGVGCQYEDLCIVPGETCDVPSGECVVAPDSPPLPIVLGDEWRYRINLDEPAAAWRDVGYDDSLWLSGPGGLCYGTDCATECNTDLVGMQTNTATTYYRREFHVNSPAAVDSLTLTITYDDSFVAFINGVEVARSNVWGACDTTTTTTCQSDGDCPIGESCLVPTFDRLAGNPPGDGSFNHECDTGGAGGTGGDEVFDITASIPNLVAGTNVIAIQGHNLTLGSSDFVQSAKLSSTESAAQGEMSCLLSSSEGAVGSTVDLEVFLENLGSLPGVRGYQTQLEITRTSGTGTVSAACPGGVRIDDLRPDYLFNGQSNDYPVTNCGLQRASSSLLSGSVIAGSADYLSDYTLEISVDATTGSTFEISFAGSPDSSLADENGNPMPVAFGPACVLTVAGCDDAGDCDDQNPCTDDACNAGTCEYTNNADPCDDDVYCNGADTCNGGTCSQHAGDPCAGDEFCNEGAGTCDECLDAVHCDDSNECTDDACNAGTCENTNNTASCDDDVFCNGADTCGGGTCSTHAGDPCAGGEFCNEGTDNCDECQVVGDCNDFNDCTDDACNAGACEYTNNTDPCNDNVFCNGADTCGGGTCSTHTGDPCAGGEFCNEGTDNCDVCQGAGDCDDSNGCTDDACVAGGCVYTNNTDSCDDGDACTTDDVCGGGSCQPGPPLDCNDFNDCTADSCDAGSCVYTPSGVCGVSGTIWYYRDHLSSSEPSVKPTPNVDIDVTQDTLPDVTTDFDGLFAMGNLAGTVQVETLDKYGVGEVSDVNNGIGAADPGICQEHAAGVIVLSANQQVAGDVSDNDEVTSYDAALIAQYILGFIPRFPVSLNNESDWAFYRCDSYVDASTHDCGAPVYLHDPLTAPVVDNFYAILYGDASGNWQPAGGPIPMTDPVEESMRAVLEAQYAQQLSLRGPALRSVSLVQPDGTAILSGAAELELTESNPRPGQGTQRREFVLDLKEADGILALDLKLRFDPRRVSIVDVRTGDLNAGFSLLTNDLGSEFRISTYGVLPMEGSGSVAIITADVAPVADHSAPFAIRCHANETLIPVRVSGAGPSASGQVEAGLKD